MTEPKVSRRAKRRQRQMDMQDLPMSSLEKQIEINSRKLFVGALGRDTTAKDVFNYFKQFGEVLDVEIKMDDVTKRCRGFAFVIFKDEKCIDTIMERNEHVIRGKTVDPKLCNMKDDKMDSENGSPTSARSTTQFQTDAGGSSFQNRAQQYNNSYSKNHPITYKNPLSAQSYQNQHGQPVPNQDPRQMGQSMQSMQNYQTELLQMQLQYQNQQFLDYQMLAAQVFQNQQNQLINQTSLLEVGLQNFQLGPMHAPLPSLTNNVLNTINTNVNTLNPNNILTSEIPNANISTAISTAIIPNANISNVFNAATLPLHQKSPQKLTETLDLDKNQ